MKRANLLNRRIVRQAYNGIQISDEIIDEYGQLILDRMVSNGNYLRKNGVKRLTLKKVVDTFGFALNNTEDMLREHVQTPGNGEDL